MILNLSQFADLAGVGRAAITLGIKRGILIKRPDGFIDTEAQENAAYLEKRKEKPRRDPEPKKKPVKKQQPKKPAPKKPAAKKAPEKNKKIPEDLPPLDDDIDDNDFEKYEGDQLTKMAVDIRLKRAQALRHELKFEQDKGNLLQIEIIEKVAARLGAEIKIRFQGLPKRITPRLYALARAGADEKEALGILEHEIDDAIESLRKILEGGL